MDVYDIYVERVSHAFDEDELDESDSEYAGNELISESEESDFEVGSWISEEDIEEVEEIRNKAKAAKENLKKVFHFCAVIMEMHMRVTTLSRMTSDIMRRQILIMKHVESRVHIRGTI
ncbi:hypothetical protein LINPERPRIM_LOCUS22696 [Linum perenne]